MLCWYSLKKSNHFDGIFNEGFIPQPPPPFRESSGFEKEIHDHQDLKQQNNRDRIEPTSNAQNSLR